jgi:hypothetical protein
VVVAVIRVWLVSGKSVCSSFRDSSVGRALARKRLASQYVETAAGIAGNLMTPPVKSEKNHCVKNVKIS